MPQQTINPANGELVKEFREENSGEIGAKLAKASETFYTWKQTPFSERKGLLLKAASVLRESKGRFAAIMTEEMGKPIRQSEGEVEKCAWVCEYYGENGEGMLKDQHIKTDASESYISFEPLGVILAIMPWNFPFWQVFRFAAPALMAGNTAILKHASNVPQCSLAIEEVFESAGFPEGCFTSILAGSSVIEGIIADNRIKAVSLTGSDAAGRKVAEAAGKNLKKTVLELGGSDPFIVLPDSDLDEVVKTAVTARMINNGQSCIAAKRFIVHKRIYNDFRVKFVSEVKMLKVGDPRDPENDLGPVAREDLLDALDTQISTSVEKGAHILVGGKRINIEGSYYEPTIISELKKGMPAYDEELFGPVASLIEASDENDALRIANDTSFGLGASIWTKDIEKAKQMAKNIESGSVFINGMVKSDPRLPFGGIKDSGFGRELSEFGIREFVNIKTVWIA